MNEQPTLGQVAQSQQVVPTQQQEQIVQPQIQQVQQVQQQQVELQQPAQNINLTGNSSGVEQTTQVEEQPQKTLNDVVRENEIAKNQQDNLDALQQIVNDANKDIVSPTSVDTSEAVDAIDEEKSQKEADQLKEQIEDVKGQKEAINVAKKIYLAFEKERRQHQLDNETNAQTIADLKEVNKQLNAKINSSEIDPRVVKLDDENYALYRIRSNYKNNSSKENKESLTKFYLTEIAVMHPELNANKLIAYMNEQSQPKNSIGENNGVAAPIAQPVAPKPRPRGIPQSERGIL